MFSIIWIERNIKVKPRKGPSLRERQVHLPFRSQESDYLARLPVCCASFKHVLFSLLEKCFPKFSSSWIECSSRSHSVSPASSCLVPCCAPTLPSPFSEPHLPSLSPTLPSALSSEPPLLSFLADCLSSELAWRPGPANWDFPLWWIPFTVYHAPCLHVTQQLYVRIDLSLLEPQHLQDLLYRFPLLAILVYLKPNTYSVFTADCCMWEWMMNVWTESAPLSSPAYPFSFIPVVLRAFHKLPIDWFTSQARLLYSFFLSLYSFVSRVFHLVTQQTCRLTNVVGIQDEQRSKPQGPMTVLAVLWQLRGRNTI